LVLFVVLVYLFFVFLIFGRYYLDAVKFGDLQDLKEQDFELQQVGEQGKCSLTMFYEP
jgi:hypothetical protein